MNGSGCRKKPFGINREYDCKDKFKEPSFARKYSVNWENSIKRADDKAVQTMNILRRFAEITAVAMTSIINLKEAKTMKAKFDAKKVREKKERLIASKIEVRMVVEKEEVSTVAVTRK